ncbi:type IV pilus modification PilV family protein [Pseudohaliea rubra]|uniref:type IV pilus modification PilV family protein n=1 Tax=Pseudohaliea rubra TaxID=475795 RepID=UPI00054D53AA|nr:prepilin-type N-terminal cleavage/methylation domain-containing protein [Pseudohaliea rubra]
MAKRSPGHRAQAGLTLVEALIAFAVLAIGLLSLVGFHGASQRELALARARAEASALAEQKLHELQSFVDVGDIPLNDPGTDAVAGVTAFTRRWEIERPADGAFGDAPASVLLAEVTVDWTDSLGQEQSVVVASELLETSPTQDAERLLAALGATGAAWSTASWEVDEESEDDCSGDDSSCASSSESDSDSESGDDCSEEDCDIDGYRNGTRYTVSGNLDGDRSEVDGIEGDGISCSFSGGRRSYSCETSPVAAGGTWSGELAFDLRGGRRLCNDEFGVVIRDRDTLVIDGISEDATVDLSVSRSCPRKLIIEGSLTGEVGRVRTDRPIRVREQDPGSANMNCEFVGSSGFRCESNAFSSNQKWEGLLVFAVKGGRRLCPNGGSLDYEMYDRRFIEVGDVGSSGTIQLRVARRCGDDD